jgi:hypothetical protein
MNFFTVSGVTATLVSPCATSRRTASFSLSVISVRSMGQKENDECRDEHNHRSRHFDDTDETGIGLPGGVEIMHLCHVALFLPM